MSLTILTKVRKGTEYHKDEELKHLPWNISTALRGPDFVRIRIKKWRLKELTTQRIRSIVGLTDTTCNGICSSFVLSTNEIKERDELLTEAPEHFRGHISRAYEAIEKITGYSLKYEGVTDRKKFEAYKKYILKVLSTLPANDI